MVDIATIIDVTTRIAAGGVAREEFGRGLIVTLDGGLSASGPGKATLFDSLDAVTDRLSAGAAVDAATVWFSADPAPQGLYLGRWASADVDTSLTGTAPAALASLASANSSLAINGTNVTGIDLSSATTYALVATAVQTGIVALTGIYTGATFAYTNNVFVLTLAGSDPIAGGVFTNAVDALGAQVGTDISVALGMSAASSPVYAQGRSAETIGEGVGDMLDAAGGHPVGVALAADVPLTVGTVDVRQALGAYAEANDLVYWLLDTSEGELVANETTSQGATSIAAQRLYTSAIYSAAGRLPDVGALAALSAQNLDNPGSLITLHAKTLPGVLPTPITSVQLAELKRKRVNVYTTVGGLPALLGSYTSRSGGWADAVWWLLWIKNRMETAIWNTQRSSLRYTRGLLLNDLDGVMQAGVANGGIQPGRRVTAAVRADIAATTGNRGFDGTLTSGYLIWVATAQATGDADARIGRFRIWATGTPTIHELFGDLTFQN